MSENRKPKRVRSLKELATTPKTKEEDGWEWNYALKVEADYVKTLKNSKDILAYRAQREEEAFIDNI